MPDSLRHIVPAEGRAGNIDGLTDYLCPIKVSCRVLYGVYSYGIYSYDTHTGMAYIAMAFTAQIVMANTPPGKGLIDMHGGENIPLGGGDRRRPSRAH